MLSKSCQYAIRSLLFISMKSEEEMRVTLKEVSDAIDSPLHFTSKILQQLVNANIVNSAKGKGGGFYITPSKLKSVSLKKIIEIIDGSSLYQGCFIGLPKCSDAEPCHVHHLFAPIKAKLNEDLLNLPISEFIKTQKKYL